LRHALVAQVGGQMVNGVSWGKSMFFFFSGQMPRGGYILPTN
jgi:hypothetical protein